MKDETLAAAKADLRRKARTERQRAGLARPGAARVAAAHAFREILAHDRASPVACYLAVRGEIDPMPLMHALRGEELDTCLPVVTAPEEPLAFHRWHPGAPLENGAYRIRVPIRGETVTPRALIVPLLSFDKQGYRLGYGGGFYDRTIAQLREAGPILTIGLAFAAQQVELLPRGTHDMPLDCVATERGLFRPQQ